MTERRPVIAISMGDPCGIGPEVVLKSLAAPARRRRARFHIYGQAEALHHAAGVSGIEPFWWQASAGAAAQGLAEAHSVTLIEVPVEIDRQGIALETRRPSAWAGEASFASVEAAIEATKRPAGDPLKADAIVTAPINKHAWSLAGHHKWPGHTELLASRMGARRVRMAFVAPELRVMLATTHVPLMKLRDLLTIGAVHETIDAAHSMCRMLGIEHPRIAVCGLNPHASEGGLFGDEEERVIEPAIRVAQQQGIEASGPFPGDTIFNAARAKRCDIVVAMYHDQGLIPVKLLAFDRAVNTTMGLPVPRTSPDHGTAFDIAYQNKADAGSFSAAVDLALGLVRGSAPASTALPRS